MDIPQLQLTRFQTLSRIDLLALEGPRLLQG